MTTRHALFLLLVVGAVWGWVAFSTPTFPAYADEPDLRVTPTAAPLPDGAKIHPAPDPTSPDAQFPDLVVTEIRIFPTTPKVNRPITIEVEIANIGPVPVTTGNNFFVDLYVNPQTAPQACVPGQAYWSVQAFQLDDGTETLRATFDPRTDEGFERFQDVGNVRLWAQVDTLFDKANNRCGNVVETREDNNLNSKDVNVETRFTQLQTAPEQFLEGFSSALDLTHPLGILQNGTGWFEEPRFPQPEDADWPIDPNEPWNSPTFYNPDRHIAVDNLPDDYPTANLPQWNPADQEKIDIEIGFDAETLYATWEDARNGNLADRDIYFSYSLDRGETWLEPLRINQDGAGSNQLRPELVIDRAGQRLFIFWEDNRLGDYDIFYARSTDFGFTWEEPTDNSEPVNPINDKNVNPTAEQKNISASVWFNDQTGESHLFIAWEDYRNGNADIFFEYSEDSGDTWLKTPDDDPTTIDANIHVQPDPSSSAGVFDQQNPYLFLDSSRLGEGQVINYCITRAYRIIYEYDGIPVIDTRHYYAQQPFPRVYMVWQDKRDVPSGDSSSIYYTRGEFNYVHPELPTNPETGNPVPEFADCENGGPRPAIPKSNLPVYRFEDDHVRLDQDDTGTIQQNPVGGFDNGGFLSYEFEQSLSDGNSERSYYCEARFFTDELVFTWQDSRDGNQDIYAVNAFDDVAFFDPVYVYVDDPDPEVSDPNLSIPPEQGCLGVNQGGLGDQDAPLVAPDEFDTIRNVDPYSPQPFEFYELAIPETVLKVSDGLTFSPKPQCMAPNEPPVFSSEPSDQTNPDFAVLPIPPTRINQTKIFYGQTLIAKLGWGVWADKRNLDNFNEDIFLRPLIREDTSRDLTVQYTESQTPDLPSFQFEGRSEIALQTVQDNVKNQIVLRRPGIQENFDPPNAQQANPSVSFALFGDPDNLDNYAFYVGWDDNRNSNPLLGYEGNKDVFATRLLLGDTINNGELQPTRTATYVSPVLGNGALATWYDIKWWGDISADGVLSIQTRFGLDPNSPEPPQENVVGNGWTQWTGVGGTGGFYTAPGQHITGPDGSFFPQSYYVQYRVNFNPAGGGQQGIHCLSEIDLNYELDFGPVYLPNLSRGRTIAD